MPIYEYRCLACAHAYEKRESFDAPARQECPACGGSARRVLHAAPIVFKGSGFYVTDNRQSAPEAEVKAKEASTKAGDGAAAGEASTKAGDGAAAREASTKAGDGAAAKEASTKAGDGAAGKDAEPTAAS